MDEIAERSGGDDEFDNLAASIAAEHMQNATPIDRAIFKSVKNCEKQNVLLKREVAELKDFRRQAQPAMALYVKLSSGYAILFYVAGGLYALIEAGIKIKGWLK